MPTPGSTEQRRENDEKFLSALEYLIAYLHVESAMAHQREKKKTP